MHRATNGESETESPACNCLARTAARTLGVLYLELDPWCDRQGRVVGLVSGFQLPFLSLYYLLFVRFRTEPSIAVKVSLSTTVSLS